MHERSQAERHYFSITHFSSKYYRNMTDLYDLALTIVDGLACIHIAAHFAKPFLLLIAVIVTFSFPLISPASIAQPVECLNRKRKVDVGSSILHECCGIFYMHF